MASKERMFPPLHVIAGKCDDRDRSLRGVIDGQLLDRHRDDLLGLPLRLTTGALLEVTHSARRLGARLILEAPDQLLSRLVPGDAGQLLELPVQLARTKIETLGGLLLLVRLRLHLGAARLLTLFPLVQQGQFSVQKLFALRQTCLYPLEIRAPPIRLLLPICLEAVGFILPCKLGRLANIRGLALRLPDDALALAGEILSPAHRPAALQQMARSDSQHESERNDDDGDLESHRAPNIYVGGVSWDAPQKQKKRPSAGARRPSAEMSNRRRIAKRRAASMYKIG
jgi:hypothetical protein